VFFWTEVGVGLRGCCFLLGRGGIGGLFPLPTVLFATAYKVTNEETLQILQ
jgi:altronate dehydratase